MDSSEDNGALTNVTSPRNNDNDIKSSNKLSDAKEKFMACADRAEHLAMKLQNKSVVKESIDRASSKKVAELELKIKDLKVEVYDLKELLEKSKTAENGACTKCSVRAEELQKSLDAIEDLKRKMKILKSQHLKALQEEKDLHEETENKYTAMYTERESLRVELGQIAVNLQTLQAKHSQLSNEHDELKRQHDSMFSISPEQYSQLSSEKQILQNELEIAQSALQQALEEKSAIVQAFDKAKEMNLKIMQATATDKAERARLTEQIVLLEKKFGTHIESLKAERETNEKEKSAVLEEMEALKRQLSEMAEQKKQLQKDLETERNKHQQNRMPSLGFPAVVKSASSGSIHTSTFGDCAGAGAMVSPQHQQFQVTFNNPLATSAPFSPPKFGASSFFGTALPLPPHSSADFADDLSVLSENTNPTKAPASHIERTVLMAPTKSNDRDGWVMISDVNPDTKHEVIVARMEQYGPLRPLGHWDKDKYRKIWNWNWCGQTRYLVCFPKFEDSVKAIEGEDGRDLDGNQIRCERFHRRNAVPYIPDPTNPIDSINHFNAHNNNFTTTQSALSVTTTNAATHLPEAYSADLSVFDKPKPHMKWVYVLHHAPSKYRMSQEDVRRTLLRFGELKRIQPVNESIAFFAEFIHVDDAQEALQNFPLHMHGYKISCKNNFTQLPKHGAVLPYEENDNHNGGTQRVILRDPALPAKRTKHCTICQDAGRSYAANTHNTEYCGFRPSRDNGGSDSSRNRRDTSRSEAPVNKSHERKRGRSESPDRPSRRSNTTNTNRTGSREVSGDGRSGSGGRVTGSGSNEVYVKKSRDEEGMEGSFDPESGVRPLSTARK